MNKSNPGHFSPTKEFPITTQSSSASAWTPCNYTRHSSSALSCTCSTVGTLAPSSICYWVARALSSCPSRPCSPRTCARCWTECATCRRRLFIDWCLKTTFRALLTAWVLSSSRIWLFVATGISTVWMMTCLSASLPLPCLWGSSLSRHWLIRWPALEVVARLLLWAARIISFVRLWSISWAVFPVMSFSCLWL